MSQVKRMRHIKEMDGVLEPHQELLNFWTDIEAHTKDTLILNKQDL